MATLTNTGATVFAYRTLGLDEYSDTFTYYPSYRLYLFDQTTENLDQTAGSIDAVGTATDNYVSFDLDDVGYVSTDWDGTDNVSRVTFDVSGDPIDVSDESHSVDSYAAVQWGDLSSLPGANPEADQRSIIWFDSIDQTLDLSSYNEVTLENPDPGIEVDAYLG